MSSEREADLEAFAARLGVFLGHDFFGPEDAPPLDEIREELQDLVKQAHYLERERDSARSQLADALSVKGTESLSNLVGRACATIREYLDDTCIKD